MAVVVSVHIKGKSVLTRHFGPANIKTLRQFVVDVDARIEASGFSE